MIIAYLLGKFSQNIMLCREHIYFDIFDAILNSGYYSESQNWDVNQVKL